MGFISPSLSGCCRKKPSEQIIEGCMIAKTQAKDGNAPAKVVNNSTRGSKKTKSEKTHVTPSLLKNCLSTCHGKTSQAVKHPQKRQEVTKNIEKKKMEKEMVTELQKFLILSTDARSSLYDLNTFLRDASRHSWFMIKHQVTRSRDHLCFSMSTETKAMLEKIEVWENKFVKSVKCLDTYKLVIKLASTTILVGLACVVIAIPQMLPVVIASGTIVKTFGDWLTTLCKKKQKELNVKKEKIFQVRQKIFEAGLDCKLKRLVEEFERFLGALVKVDARSGSVEVDHEEVMKEVDKVAKSIEELKMKVADLLPVMEEVLASVQDVIIYMTKEKSY